MKLLLALAMLIPGSAFAVSLPHTCADAHQLEREAIPQFLGMPPGSNRIVSITDYTPTMRWYAYAPPSLMELDCTITVTWANGYQDLGATFAARQDPRGGIDINFSPTR